MTLHIAILPYTRTPITQYGIIYTADAADRRLTRAAYRYLKLLPLAQAPEAPAQVCLTGANPGSKSSPLAAADVNATAHKKSLLLVLQLRAPPIQTQRFFIARASSQARS